MWTRRGDWKLIRLFHDGDDQSDRFELYNLRDDLSEAKNLAAQFPDKVHELDALIDQHLRDTHVLVPGKNPAYSPLVPDWTSNPDTSLTVRDGVLVITPTGKGPSMNTRGLPAAKGPFTVELRMKSNSKGGGRVFWSASPKDGYAPERAVKFTPQHDNAWHDYEVKLPVEKAIQVLRLDPSAAPGEMRVEFLRLKDAGGQLVKGWQFDRSN